MMKTPRASFSRTILALAISVSIFGCEFTSAPAANVLRVVPTSDLESIDPIFSTAVVSRDYAYMIYDTLFGMDSSGRISPQMVQTYDVSSDKKTWTFTLRDGLEFHDGKPVTTEDVIASLIRWSKKDVMGLRLFSFVERIESVNTKTFRMKLSAPYGLVLDSLGKPSSYVPFIMPKRIAVMPVDQQITDPTGSGPFVLKQDERKPGEKVVFVRNLKYKPRAEPASGTAGGKVVKVDRVEWLIIRDAQTQANALAAGQIDMIESLPFEMYPIFKKDPNIQLIETNPLGNSFMLRFNHLQPPFNNVKVRQAAMAAMNQLAFLQTQVGIPALYRTCFSIYPCGTSYANDKGMDFIAKPDMNHARQLLRESGYDGAPVVLLQQTDQATLNRLPAVAKQLLEQAGFKVQMQPMNFQTLFSRRARKDGWNIYVSFLSVSSINPVSNMYLAASGYPTAQVGWPSDPLLEKLRDDFALAQTDADRKTLAEKIQARAMEIGVYVPLGEYVVKVAARKNITGFVTGFFTVYWNVEKR